MKINKKNLLSTLLLISLIGLFIVMRGQSEDVKANSGETIRQGISDSLISIKLDLSSDDIRYLNGGLENDNWRKVKLFKGSKSYKINIKNGTLKDEAYQIRIDNIAYHLHRLNTSTLEKYSFLQGAKLKGLATTSPELIKLYYYPL